MLYIKWKCNKSIVFMIEILMATKANAHARVLDRAATLTASQPASMRFSVIYTLLKVTSIRSRPSIRPSVR